MGAFRQPFPAVSVQLTATSTDAGNILYTCPSGTKAEVRKCTFLNTTGTGRLVSVHIVRSGDAIATKNQIWVNAPIPLNTTATRGVECFEAEGQMLNPGDKLIAFADAATAITPNGAVVEFT